MPLTDKAVLAAKPKEKNYRKAGLCLLKTFKSLKSIGVFDVCKSAWQ